MRRKAGGSWVDESCPYIKTRLRARVSPPARRTYGSERGRGRVAAETCDQSRCSGRRPKGKLVARRRRQETGHGWTRISTDKSPVGCAERTGRSAHARGPQAIAVVRQTAEQATVRHLATVEVQRRQTTQRVERSGQIDTDSPTFRRCSRSRFRALEVSVMSYQMIVPKQTTIRPIKKAWMMKFKAVFFRDGPPPACAEAPAF